jgi:hypothetical protein
MGETYDHKKRLPVRVVSSAVETLLSFQIW